MRTYGENRIDAPTSRTLNFRCPEGTLRRGQSTGGEPTPSGSSDTLPGATLLTLPGLRCQCLLCAGAAASCLEGGGPAFHGTCEERPSGGPGGPSSSTTGRGTRTLTSCHLSLREWVTEGAPGLLSHSLFLWLRTHRPGAAVASI